MLLETQAVYCQCLVAASKQQGTAPGIAGSSVKPSSVSQAEGAPFTSPGSYFFSKAAAWGGEEAGARPWRGPQTQPFKILAMFSFFGE